MRDALDGPNIVREKHNINHFTRNIFMFQFFAFIFNWMRLGSIVKLNATMCCGQYSLSFVVKSSIDNDSRFYFFAYQMPYQCSGADDKFLIHESADNKHYDMLKHNLSAISTFTDIQLLLFR